MDLTLATLNEIWVGLELRYQAAYQNAEPWSAKVATSVPSKTKITKMGWIGKIPRMRLWTGERTLNNLAAREYAITNQDFELTIEIDRNDIIFDQLGLYIQGVDLLGEQAKVWADDLVYGLMTYGDSSTPQTLDTGAVINPEGFDGNPFFYGSHPIDINNTALATQSNLFNSTTSGDLPLNGANYGSTVRPAMAAYKGEDNRPMGIIPDTLAVPPALEVTAYTIANATLVAQAVGANAATGASENVIPMLKGAVKPLMIPQLAGADDTWYVLCTSKPVKPFAVTTVKAPEFVPLDKPTDPNVWERKKFRYGVDLIGSAGYSLWFLAAKAANH
ncbi:MAG TPA: Mu-like prophage major head subunit gpT family protein [Myxococcales bacterium]|nr:Mu-like prophage major head subunit gpT family protein [Myxococcales bacterium]